MNTVRITNDSPISNKAKLTIGNQIIPFYEVNINLKAGEFATLTATVPIEQIDLQAFEHNTDVNLVRVPTLEPRKWIGNDTMVGRLRYWYYKKRGRVIEDQYFYVGKPAHEAIKIILDDFKAKGGKIKKGKS